jgi:hypothetical protein
MSIDIRIPCTAMFICEGLHDSGYDKVIAAAAAKCEGWCETVEDISKYAEFITTHAQRFVDLEFDYPGVFDYEVSAPFGRWFGEQLIAGTWPSVTQAHEKIKELVMRFFTQGMRCSA